MDAKDISYNLHNHFRRAFKLQKRLELWCAVLASSLQKASNLSDLVNAATARTNLGLKSASTMSSTAFDPAGAAAARAAKGVNSDITALATASEEQAKAAIASAHTAFLAWRSVPAPRRGELVRRLGEELRAIALLRVGATEFWTGRYEEAERHLEHARTLARQIGRPYLEFASLVYWARVQLGRSFTLVLESSRQAIELAQHAKEAGADAILVVTPYYNKPTQEGMFLHFSAIADSADIPMIIYNIPPRSVVDMSVETMARLAKHKI